MLLICSRASLDRPNVIAELEMLLDRETATGTEELLIPIRLDRYVLNEWKPSRTGLAETVRARVIGDFEGADTDTEKFGKGLRRLLTVLKKTPEPLPGSG